MSASTGRHFDVVSYWEMVLDITSGFRTEIRLSMASDSSSKTRTKPHLDA